MGINGNFGIPNMKGILPAGFLAQQSPTSTGMGSPLSFGGGTPGLNDITASTGFSWMPTMPSLNFGSFNFGNMFGPMQSMAAPTAATSSSSGFPPAGGTASWMPTMDYASMFAAPPLQKQAPAQQQNQFTGMPQIAMPNMGGGNLNPSSIMSGDTLAMFNMTNNAVSSAHGIFQTTQAWLATLPPPAPPSMGESSTGSSAGSSATSESTGEDSSSRSFQPTGDKEQDAIAWAESQLGVSEASNPDAVRGFSQGRWEAWCAHFVSTALEKAGGSPFGHQASVQSIMDWGKSHNRFIAKGSGTPRVGDVMIQKSAGASHTGIVTKVNADGSFETIEGNTSDKVARRSYSANDAKLTGFVRPYG